jgi:hypothetical protein
MDSEGRIEEKRREKERDVEKEAGSTNFEKGSLRSEKAGRIQ